MCLYDRNYEMNIVFRIKRVFFIFVPPLEVTQLNKIFTSSIKN